MWVTEVKGNSALIATLILLAVVLNSLLAISNLTSKSSKTAYLNYQKVLKDIQLRSVRVDIKYEGGNIYAKSELPIKVIGVYLENKSGLFKLRAFNNLVSTSLTKLVDLGSINAINSSLILVFDSGKILNLSIDDLTNSSTIINTTKINELTGDLRAAKLLAFATGTIYLPTSYLTLKDGPKAYGAGRVIHPKWFFTLSYGIDQTHAVDLAPNEDVNTYFSVTSELINSSSLNVSGKISSSESTTAFIGQFIHYQGLKNITLKISISGKVIRGIEASKYVAIIAYYVIPDSFRIDFPINPVTYIATSGIIPIVPVERRLIAPIETSAGIGTPVTFNYTTTVNIDLSSSPYSGYIIVGCELAFKQYINYYFQSLKVVSYS